MVEDEQYLGILENKYYVQLPAKKLGGPSFNFITPPYLDISQLPGTYWKLDDGSPIPDRKYFQDWSFNVQSRTFKGTVDWPISAKGYSKWYYEMIFDSEFNKI